MARENALNIYTDNSTKDKLAEAYGNVIEAVQKGAVSEQIKNKNYSGDPSTGSVEVDRFKNASVDALGTARTGGKGKHLTNSGKVTINIDTDKEIVEELAMKDVKLYGLAGMAEKRKENHVKRMIAFLDNAFFTEAETAGTSVNLTSYSTVADKLEALVQSVETTENDWVDGVDRDQIVLTVKPAIYGALLNHIDSVPNSLTGLKDDYFHGVRIFPNHRQGKDMICMIDGAIAQPVVTDEYNAEKIPLSNDIALELFFSKGTKAVMPDLIKFSSTGTSR